MRPASIVIIVAGLLASSNAASAEALRVAVIKGDIYLWDTNGTTRLTQDGNNSDTTLSRDGTLIAFVHNDGQQDMTSLYVCSVVSRQCQKLVAPQRNNQPQLNLTNFSSPRFSYQASADRNGTPIGSIFFLAEGWATSGAIHRATLGPNQTVTFVTDANSLAIVPSGKFAGALDITQHTYSPNGACDQERIFDPNTKKVLQTIPTPDCQALQAQ